MQHFISGVCLLDNVLCSQTINRLDAVWIRLAVHKVQTSGIAVPNRSCEVDAMRQSNAFAISMTNKAQDTPLCKASGIEADAVHHMAKRRTLKLFAICGRSNRYPVKLTLTTEAQCFSGSIRFCHVLKSHRGLFC